VNSEEFKMVEAKRQELLGQIKAAESACRRAPRAAGPATTSPATRPSATSSQNPNQTITDLWKH